MIGSSHLDPAKLLRNLPDASVIRCNNDLRQHLRFLTSLDNALDKRFAGNQCQRLPGETRRTIPSWDDPDSFHPRVLTGFPPIARMKTTSPFMLAVCVSVAAITFIEKLPSSRRLTIAAENRRGLPRGGANRRLSNVAVFSSRPDHAPGWLRAPV